MSRSLKLLPDTHAGKNKIRTTQGNCFLLIQTLENNSIDLIATDPPYEINYEKNQWDRPNSLNWDFLAKEFKRVLKPGGSLVVFQGWSQVCETKSILDKYFSLQNWIIYDRVKGRGAKTNVVSTREDILWYTSSEKQYTFHKIDSNIKKKTGGMGKKNGREHRAISNVWTDIPPLVPWSREKVPHPTQKPVFIMKRILEMFSNENDTVLDPFMGSGTTALACRDMSRNFVGFELDKDYYKLCERRLNE
ncbi:MAG: site-specific DNA-methyltransferase [Candidatus Dadabacteria bacterium]|nr:site-specific DNA-methyltransferase [Candidatus Dadabacteria bacterium]